MIKVRSIGASILDHVNTRRSETSPDLQDLVQSLATILAELDLELAEANDGETVRASRISDTPTPVES